MWARRGAARGSVGSCALQSGSLAAIQRPHLPVPAAREQPSRWECSAGLHEADLGPAAAAAASVPQTPRAEVSLHFSLPASQLDEEGKEINPHIPAVSPAMIVTEVHTCRGNGAGG